MEVLGIEVARDLAERWRDWLMPSAQPFVVPRPLALEEGLSDGRPIPMEVIDAFELYTTPSDRTVVTLERAAARRLPSELRRAQPHRWPTADVAADLDRTVRWVARGRRPSRHREVSAATWRAARTALPGARSLAGTFPTRSGPNCFATVMAAAGVEGAEREWMQVEPFESWLGTRAERVGRGTDHAPGVVMVWRDAFGVATHAAVTIGDGWLLQKHSQGWMSPTTVLLLRPGMLAARCRGSSVHRYRLH